MAEKLEEGNDTRKHYTDMRNEKKPDGHIRKALMEGCQIFARLTKRKSTLKASETA